MPSTPGGRRCPWRELAANRGASARYDRSLPAQLAQLVEHFHGKEGVIGSSPMLGLAR